MLSIGEQLDAPCVGAGTPVERTTQAGRSATVQSGEVLRANVIVFHGTCDEPTRTRTVVGSVQLDARQPGAPTVTLW